MSTEQISKINSGSSSATLELAKQIGSKLQGGEVIELVSDLGGGKTTFVRGLAEGMGSHDVVHSPSFTLSNQYQSSDLTLYHFDFYRLQEPGIMREEIIECLQDPNAVVAVEWADIVEDVLPPHRLVVRFQTMGEEDRQITFEYPPELAYLLKNNT